MVSLRKGDIVLSHGVLPGPDELVARSCRSSRRRWQCLSFDTFLVMRYDDGL